jgi:hypothetical protein
LIRMSLENERRFNMPRPADRSVLLPFLTHCRPEAG